MVSEKGGRDADGESLQALTRRVLLSHAAAGAAAGLFVFFFCAIAATFMCPLDVIKTRLQVHGLPEGTHSGRRGSIIIISLQNILKNEGLKGLYRGLSPTLLALLPNWAVYFAVYERLKGLLRTHGDGNSQLSVGKNMIAAAGAGAATAIATNPLWVVKTRLQTQGMRSNVVPYKSILSALRRIAHEEGMRGLYSGILPSLAGVSHVAIQFPAYERIKHYMAKKDDTDVDKLNPGSIMIASSIAKVLASVITYPHEVVRSRLQEQGQNRKVDVQYAGVVDCVKKVFQKEGFPGFYRGCATNLLRTTPSAVITFTSYEIIQSFLLRVLPPDKNHSQIQPKSGEHVKPQQKIDEAGAEENDTLRQSQIQSNKLTPSIPLGSKDQLTARH
ncbi:Nicotinamide adenine dinucleotide transporter 2 [Citrus sinensis]|uniref:Nicotinamide adenine dinucleotide transporter 2 n=2 Tax=Citrus sinensis TaxID=2711 RepID=A0ACB8NB18_CITSI|nr:Nicotinamide adenine dinucleotide transporter 2 [Citrus sinensis]